MPTQIPSAFRAMDAAIVRGELIQRVSRDDKEFHFQRWVASRLSEARINYDEAGRNSYPDLTLVNTPEGLEVKGLGYPGREANFDGNSQVPRPTHSGRSLYYVFGRYPSRPDGNEYPVHDLVIVPGSFLNADEEYQHENKSILAFGSYGDILLRDRKMYVIPTPWALLVGTEGTRTLILPADLNPGEGFVAVGTLVRTEVAQMMVGYSFDLQTNVLNAHFAPNPTAGKQHHFRAWRVERPDGVGAQVRIRSEPRA